MGYRKQDTFSVFPQSEATSYGRISNILALEYLLFSWYD